MKLASTPLIWGEGNVPIREIIDEQRWDDESAVNNRPSLRRDAAKPVSIQDGIAAWVADRPVKGRIGSMQVVTADRVLDRSLTCNYLNVWL
ncbi:MAG: hypothetical protein KJ755_07835, partial [Alphaproteobacteria bacterium]|nr:hypothetical protein [Alphaproteobacteria bacterium]